MLAWSPPLFMRALQRVETADKNYQYLLFAAEPYEVRFGSRLRGSEAHRRW